jgi:hypothetical protein
MDIPILVCSTILAIAALYMWTTIRIEHIRNPPPPPPTSLDAERLKRLESDVKALKIQKGLRGIR